MSKICRKLFCLAALGTAAAGIAAYIKNQKESDENLKKDMDELQKHAKDAACAAREVASNLKDKIITDAGETVKKVKNSVNDTYDSEDFKNDFEDTIKDMKDDAAKVYHDIKDSAQDVAKDVKEAASNAAEKTSDAINEVKDEFFDD